MKSPKGTRALVVVVLGPTERRRVNLLTAASRALTATAALTSLLLVWLRLAHPLWLRPILPGADRGDPLQAFALLFVVAGTEVWRARLDADSPLRTNLQRALAAAAAATSIASLFAGSADLGAGLGIAGAGLALLVMPLRTARTYHAALGIFFLPLAMGSYSLLSILYGATDGPAFASRLVSDLATAYCLTALAIAGLLADPEESLLRVLIRDDAGGRVARFLLPLAFLFPVLVAFARLRAEVRGLYGLHFGVLLAAGSFAAASVAAVIWVSSTTSRAEGRRQESEQQFRSVINTAGEGIVTTNFAGLIVLANRATEIIFERNPNELIGQPFRVLLAEPDVARHESALARFIAAGEARIATTLNLHGRRRDGSEFPIELSIATWHSSAGQFITTIIRDTSRRQLVEDALRAAKKEADAAARAKAEFLANMSHEIRTPMNAVIGMTSLLQGTRLDAEQLDFANTIRSSGEHLMTIINDILDFSKIESGKLELERIPLEVRRVVEESIDLVAMRAQEKGLEIGYFVEGDIPASIYGDPGRLRQVLLNLLSNAVKFTHKGEVVVRVSGKPMADGRTELHFAVQDSGIGIPEDRFHVLFQMFSQVDTSTTRAFGGTGLGLAISKRLTELMGGRIWVESKAGQGSTFQFTIPVAEAPLPPKPVGVGWADLLAGKRVLVVDDNATNRKIFRLQCERWGMRVREADSGAMALEWLRAGEHFDIAIIDHQMPTMDGVELSMEIRKFLGPDVLPIVVASSLGGKPEGYEQMLVQSFLNKPVKQSALMDVIMEIIGGKQETPAPHVEAAPPVTDEATGTLRILLAEDNIVNQKVATRMMEKLGYKPNVVSDGEEALAAAKAKVFDVIFMDVQMPKMDGLEATRRIRQEVTPRPFIVAMTAHAMPGDREKCLEAGMDDYITKPVRLETLSALLGSRKVTP